MTLSLLRFPQARGLYRTGALDRKPGGDFASSRNLVTREGNTGTVIARARRLLSALLLETRPEAVYATGTLDDTTVWRSARAAGGYRHHEVQHPQDGRTAGLSGALLPSLAPARRVGRTLLARRRSGSGAHQPPLGAHCAPQTARTRRHFPRDRSLRRPPVRPAPPGGSLCGHARVRE